MAENEKEQHISEESARSVFNGATKEEKVVASESAPPEDEVAKGDEGLREDGGDKLRSRGRSASVSSSGSGPRAFSVSGAPPEAGDTVVRDEGTPRGEAAPVQDSIQASSLADQPTDTDRLGFDAYVKAVSQFLSNPATEPPLTMSIEGEWGCGKSSFMRMVRKALESGESSKKFVTVWFNPWRHDQEESLWSAFALQCMRDIA